ncbi:hypothetical protein ACW73L_19490 [Methylolobus aquaticus]
MTSGPFSPGVVAVAGSRAVSSQLAVLVGPVCRALVRGGCSMAVGCCAGVDAAVLAAVGRGFPAARVTCFAAFGPGGAGAGPASAVAAVQAFAAAGGAVSWWAGGGPAVPLFARLAARTGSVVAQASAGAVVFFAAPVSRGSALAVRLALARGLPVLAFPLGFPGAALPLPRAGVWVPAGLSGPWSGAWRWVSSQATVFDD